MNDDLKPVRLEPQNPLARLSDRQLPAAVQQAGPASAFGYEEFLFGQIRETNTRCAYQAAVNRFLDWLKANRLPLAWVLPKDVGAYLNTLKLAIPFKKPHRAALNRFFDLQVQRHAVILNPVSSVRSERYQLSEGKTPEITVKQGRSLFQSIDASKLVGLRDRAVIVVLVYSGSRMGAVTRLQRKHLVHERDQWVLAFHDKGSKHRKVPVRHDLQQTLLDYLNAAAIPELDKETPLFRSSKGKARTLSETGMAANDMQHTFKRRLFKAGLPASLSPHSFRVATITNVLTQGVPLEDVENLANHADPRITRLHERRKRRVTRNIVERIAFYDDVEA